MKKTIQRCRYWWLQHPKHWVVAVMAAVIVALALRLLFLSDAIQILLVYALVVLTSRYARETRRIAKANEEATFASLRPIIVMGRTPSFRTQQVTGEVFTETEIVGRTWLCRMGPGPAVNLRFSLKEPNRINTSQHVSGSAITAFGSGEVYELVLENVFEQLLWCSHDLLVEYEDVFGKKWRSGLELGYTSGADHFKVLNLFYEKMEDEPTTPKVPE
jgi:hypothetical protein